MKTIVVCAIFVLELVSSFPFPEAAYFDTYEPREIQIPTLAHSPDLYEQQQLYIKQQNDNIRRQNYENLLRNEILTRPSYNIQPVLNTVREPYINSIPLQRPIQRAQYEAPLTPQYYPVQRQQPIRQYQPVHNQEYQVATEAHAEAGNSQGAIQQTSHPYHYAQFNAQNLAAHPRIQQVLASTPLKKRYLVLHPNGTIEHIDKIEHIVEQHPNYILLNAGSVTPQKESTKPGSAQSPVVPQAPVAPKAPNAPVTQAVPNAPVPPVAPNIPPAPNTPAAPTVPAAPVAPSPLTAPVAPVAPNAPPPATNEPAPVGPIAGPAEPPSPVNSKPKPPPPGPKPTVQPPTGPTTALPPITAQTAQPPVLLNGTGPSTNGPTNVPPPVILNGTIPGPKPAVPQSTGPTTVLPPVSAPTAQPPVWVTATATAIYPPPTTPLPPVTATATATATAIEVTTPVPPTTEDPNHPNCPTTVAPYIKPNDKKNNLDVLQVNGAKPVVWFRTKDLDFWEKLTSGDETFDVVYFFNVPREPRVTKETKTTIHADGTVVEEVTQTICDDEDLPPRIIKTTTVTKPDGTQSKT